MVKLEVPHLPLYDTRRGSSRLLALGLAGSTDAGLIRLDHGRNIWFVRLYFFKTHACDGSGSGIFCIQYVAFNVDISEMETLEPIRRSRDSRIVMSVCLGRLYRV